MKMVSSSKRKMRKIGWVDVGQMEMVWAQYDKCLAGGNTSKQSNWVYKEKWFFLGELSVQLCHWTKLQGFWMARYTSKQYRDMWMQQHKTQKRILKLQVISSTLYFGNSLEKKSWKVVFRQCQTKTTQIWSHVPTIVCSDDQLFCRYKVYRQNILLSFACENTSQAGD